MIINEVIQDLFTVPQGYYLINFINNEYIFDLGIPQKFKEVYNMEFKINKFYNSHKVGEALLVDNVFNLVIKKRFKKSTYEIIYDALIDMKNQCGEKCIKKLAAPIYEHKLDGIYWETIKDMIEEIFKETDIEILICDTLEII